MRKSTLTAFIVLLLCVGSAWAQTARRKIIIDQDTFGSGGPNNEAILLALQAPNVDVLGITVESGDGWQDENLAHVLRMLELVKRTDVPVYRGSTYPLVNSMARTKRWEGLYGAIPYKGAWQETWPEYNSVDRTPYHGPTVVPPQAEGMPTLKPAEGSAADFMIRMVHKYPGQVTIMGLGPLTNIALAARLDDEFTSLAEELIFMGASFHPIPAHPDEFSAQEANTPSVNFNWRWDPEAAYITLHSAWKKIVVMPSDGTVDTKLTPELLKQATASQSLSAQYVGKYNMVNFPLWDEATVEVWLDPTIITKQQRLAMDVDLSSGASYGASLSWAAGHGPGLGEPDVDVIFGLDNDKLNALFAQLIAK